MTRKFRLFFFTVWVVWEKISRVALNAPITSSCLSSVLIEFINESADVCFWVPFFELSVCCAFKPAAIDRNVKTIIILFMTGVLLSWLNYYFFSGAYVADTRIRILSAI